MHPAARHWLRLCIAAALCALPACSSLTSALNMVLPTAKPATAVSAVTPTSRHTAALSATQQPPLLLSLPAATLHVDGAAVAQRLRPATPTSATIPATAQAARPIAAPAAAPIPTAPPIPLLDETVTPPNGFLLPSGLFAKSSKLGAAPASAATPTGATTGSGAVSAKPAENTTAAPAPPSATADTRPQVPLPLVGVTVTKAKQAPLLLYASPTTRAYLAAGGVNYQNNIDTWIYFLQRQNFQYTLVTSLDGLDKAANGTVLLPSAIALSESEKRALARFRDDGGAILATWLCGTRNEQGRWVGFGFMESVLNTKVSGNTEADPDDAFLIPYGDSPVSHQLPSGLRVWTERVPGWYPLRLTGAHTAGSIMDWSRNVRANQSNGVIAWDNRDAKHGRGRQSRAVILGYPERLWLSAERSAMDALAHDALTWLLRQPQVYAAAWPYPHGSAMILTINTTDATGELDLGYAKQIKDMGWRATYYVLSERAEDLKPVLEKLQSGGHDIGYFGDRLVGFQNQSLNEQKKRFKNMLREMKDAGFAVQHGGFRAPMEAYDATTVGLLKLHGFNYMVTDQGASETRLPLLTEAAKTIAPLALLPRTMSAPEDFLSEGNSAQAIQRFLAEITLTDDMAALGVISIPTRSSLSPEQWDAILAHVSSKGSHAWLATASQVAQWWRARERVKVWVNADVSPALLTVEVTGDAPLTEAITLLANLPEPGGKLHLVADAAYLVTPTVSAYDPLRAAIVLDGLAPGKYYWYLNFH
jgi:peptidoglycan/xylan/chitin deacetylase (PgdA/CDA1 family)